MFKTVPVALALVFAMALPVAAQTVDPATIPDPQVGVPYTQTFTSTGVMAPLFTNPGGGLPDGLTFSQGSMSGIVSGTPTAAGSFTFTIQASGMGSASRAYTGNVQPAAVSAVPTLSEWAMIVFGTALAGGAAVMIQRRRLVA